MKPWAPLLTLLSVALPAQADVLGRLFFTPAERQQLELRQSQLELQTQLTADKGNESGNQSVITINGIIQRGDGSRIVWINGKAQKIEAGGDPNKAPIRIPGKSKPLEVKVGQRVLIKNPSPAKNSSSTTSGDDQ